VFTRLADAKDAKIKLTVTDYVDGHFRVKFSGAAELRDQVARSVRAIVDTGPPPLPSSAWTSECRIGSADLATLELEIVRSVIPISPSV
jgi:hypothetical protein